MIPFLWNGWKSRRGPLVNTGDPRAVALPRVGHPPPAAAPTGQSENSNEAT
jgi:hypothetical protein